MREAPIGVTYVTEKGAEGPERDPSHLKTPILQAFFADKYVSINVRRSPTVGELSLGVEE